MATHMKHGMPTLTGMFQFHPLSVTISILTLEEK